MNVRLQCNVGQWLLLLKATLEIGHTAHCHTYIVSIKFLGFNIYLAISKAEPVHIRSLANNFFTAWTEL